jgi:hypothetical protein
MPQSEASGEQLFQGNYVNPPYGYRQVETSIFEATTATQGGAPKAYCSGGSTYGCPAVGALIAFQNRAATTSDIRVHNTGFNNKTFTFGANIYRDPGFASLRSLSIRAPNCSGDANTTACMLQGYNVAGDLTPSGAAVGKGYQPPGAMYARPLFPNLVERNCVIGSIASTGRVWRASSTTGREVTSLFGGATG